MKARHDIRAHWELLTAMLERGSHGSAVRADRLQLLSARQGGRLRRDNAFIIGDAAGLATRDLAEGIGPAVRSGLRAAQAILEGTEFDLSDVTGTSLTSIARSMFDRTARAVHWPGDGGTRRITLQELPMAYVTVINEHAYVQQVIWGITTSRPMRGSRRAAVTPDSVRASCCSRASDPVPP